MIASEVQAYLEDLALGTAGTDIFADEMPPEPAACVAVIDYPGRSPEYALGQTTPTIEHSSVQIRARAASKGAARTKIRAVYNALSAVRNATINGSFFLKMTPVQQPYRLEIDLKRRPVFAFNLEVEKRR